MKMKNKKFLGLIFGLTLIMLLAACGGGDEGADSEENVKVGEDAMVVKIGSLWDITGGSGDTGTPYSEGQTAYFKYLQSNGGIEGVHIDHSGEDYGYEISDAQRTYQSFRDRDNAVGILGWGTGDTEAMREQVAADEIPYISASYSEALNNPEANPYNFFIAASYSDQGRMVLDWIKENHEGGEPTFALIYGDNGFGRSPIEDIKAYSKEVGVEHVGDFIIELDATEAQSQMLNMQKAAPDYVIVQETWGATAVALREAQTLGIETQFIGLNQAVGEGLIEQAGADVTEGFIGTLTHALPYEEVEGMDEYKEYLEAEGKSIEDINMQHVAGWVSGKVMAEAVKIAAENTDDDEITGAELKEALESMDNFDLGGLAAPVGFDAEDHAGTDEVRLGKVTDGKWEAFTDYISADK